MQEIMLISRLDFGSIRRIFDARQEQHSMANEKCFDLAAWQRAIAQQSSMPAKTAVIAMRLADLATPDGLLQGISRPQIADTIKADVRALDRTVRALEALGFLVVERKDGRGYTNRYEFKLPGSDRALGAPHEQSSTQIGEPVAADCPSHQSRSGPELAAIAYLENLGTVINERGIRGLAYSRDRVPDETVVAALQPALDALLDTDGVKSSQRLPAGYRRGLMVMHAIGLLREKDLSAARDLARELRVPETDTEPNTV
jgi:hypothetical protein